MGCFVSTSKQHRIDVVSLTIEADITRNLTLDDWKQLKLYDNCLHSDPLPHGHTYLTVPAAKLSEVIQLILRRNNAQICEYLARHTLPTDTEPTVRGHKTIHVRHWSGLLLPPSSPTAVTASRATHSSQPSRETFWSVSEFDTGEHEFSG